MLPAEPKNVAGRAQKYRRRNPKMSLAGPKMPLAVPKNVASAA